MISVTRDATEKFNEAIQNSNSPEKTVLRVSFGGYGWGGPKLQIALDELKNNNDKVVHLDGIKVVYDPQLESYVNGAVIDYTGNWFGRGFLIRGGDTSSC